MRDFVRAKEVYDNASADNPLPEGNELIDMVQEFDLAEVVADALAAREDGAE